MSWGCPGFDPRSGLFFSLTLCSGNARPVLAALVRSPILTAVFLRSDGALGLEKKKHAFEEPRVGPYL